MEVWPHFGELKSVLETSPLPEPALRREQGLMFEFTRVIHAWQEERGLDLRVVCDKNEMGMDEGLHFMPHSPGPVVCSGQKCQSWPDIAIFSQDVCIERLVNYSDPLDDWLVGIEIKLLKKGGTELWGGIGQAAVNALAYRHSILAVVDARPEPRESPRRGVLVSAREFAGIAERQWNIHMVWRAP